MRRYLPNGSDVKYVTGGGTKPPFRDPDAESMRGEQLRTYRQTYWRVAR